jgi:hypothetical protein
MLAVQALQAFARNVRVNGGGGNIGMAQQHLHSPQIGTVVQQMRGKRVAQGVR